MRHGLCPDINQLRLRVFSAFPVNFGAGGPHQEAPMQRALLNEIAKYKMPD